MDVTSELLDDLENRLEELRRAARQLIDEKDSLVVTLDEIDKGLDDDINAALSEVDKEDLKIRVSQLNLRVSSICIDIKVVRDDQQQQALTKVNDKVSELISDIETGHPDVLAKAQSYLDACTKGTGTKFEALILSCASDDQKIVRKKIEQLVENIQSLESTVDNGDSTKKIKMDASDGGGKTDSANTQSRLSLETNSTNDQRRPSLETSPANDQRRPSLESNPTANDQRRPSLETNPTANDQRRLSMEKDLDYRRSPVTPMDLDSISDQKVTSDGNKLNQ